MLSNQISKSQSITAKSLPSLQHGAIGADNTMLANRYNNFDSKLLHILKIITSSVSGLVREFLIDLVFQNIFWSSYTLYHLSLVVTSHLGRGSTSSPKTPSPTSIVYQRPRLNSI
ncbi:hypothetical protein L204_102703 [Cryptococcus depauperatus]